MTANHNESVSVLSSVQYERVSECLSGLAEKLSIVSVLLVDSGGRIISHRTQSAKSFDQTILGTLCASSFAAAKEMASRVEDRSNFKMILFEGDQLNLFISSVNLNTLLVIVFETGVAVGMVRLFVRKTIEALKPILGSEGEDTEHLRKIFNGQFNKQLDAELDRLFIEKD